MVAFTFDSWPTTKSSAASTSATAMFASAAGSVCSDPTRTALIACREALMASTTPGETLSIPSLMRMIAASSRVVCRQQLVDAGGHVGRLPVGLHLGQVFRFLQLLQAGGEREVARDEMLVDLRQLRAKRLPNRLDARRPVLHVWERHRP